MNEGEPVQLPLSVNKECQVEKLESQELSWEYVSADKLLSHGPCELHYVQLTADAGNADITLYDGTSTSGKKIMRLETLQNVTQQSDLTKPVYCSRGLYVDVGSNVDGALIIFKELAARPRSN